MELRDYLHVNRLTVKEMADRLRYTRTHLSMIVNGKAFPSPRLAEDIEKFTEGKVKTSQWKNIKKKTAAKKSFKKPSG